MFVKIINGLLDFITLIVDWLITLLPDTPFQFSPLEWGSFGKMVGAVFPVATMFMHMTAIITAFALYYVARWGLRVIRAVK